MACMAIVSAVAVFEDIPRTIVKQYMNRLSVEIMRLETCRTNHIIGDL